MKDNSKEILKEIDFYIENKEAFSKEERKLIKIRLRNSLKNLGDSVVKLIDLENNR
ncbi:hypothetical protein [Aquimarina algiphila]|uniref:hypothetical protein n=1 Tax=Aquimarina algiphila TaxID=2047982 RepID=UPI0014309DED|nr:hypothetical protein [Aquimarina algiphila]